MVDTAPVTGSPAYSLALEPTIVDEKTGARWNWTPDGYHEAMAPWAHEGHVGPILADEHFGDVESWAKYVKTYAPAEMSFLSWSRNGLKAVLDYHLGSEEPGRTKWHASHTFERSLEWRNWHGLADDKPHSQKEVVEKLEEWADDILEPTSAELANILRAMRANVNAQAETTVNADGTSSVRFTKDNKVTPLGNVDLPESFKIAIPVLAGHEELNTDGRYVPVTYVIKVRVRVAIQDNAALFFRLSLQGDQKILDEVIAYRVAKAIELLGDGFTLYRGVD